MTLLLTKKCQYAILVAIERAQDFPPHPDRELFVQTRLHIPLPPNLSDLIPPSTLLSTIPVSNVKGSPKFNSTVGYCLSGQLVNALSESVSNEGKVTIDICELAENGSDYTVIASTVLSVRKARWVESSGNQPSNGTGVSAIKAFVRDKGGWNVVTVSKGNKNSTAYVKAGLFITEMPHPIDSSTAFTPSPTTTTFSPAVRAWPPPFHLTSRYLPDQPPTPQKSVSTPRTSRIPLFSRELSLPIEPSFSSQPPASLKRQSSELSNQDAETFLTSALKRRAAQDEEEERHRQRMRQFHDRMTEKFAHKRSLSSKLGLNRSSSDSFERDSGPDSNPFKRRALRHDEDKEDVSFNASTFGQLEHEKITGENPKGARRSSRMCLPPLPPSPQSLYSADPTLDFQVGDDTDRKFTFYFAICNGRHLNHLRDGEGTPLSSRTNSPIAPRGFLGNGFDYEDMTYRFEYSVFGDKICTHPISLNSGQFTVDKQEAATKTCFFLQGSLQDIEVQFAENGWLVTQLVGNAGKTREVVGIAEVPLRGIYSPNDVHEAGFKPSLRRTASGHRPRSIDGNHLWDEKPCPIEVQQRSFPIYTSQYRLLNVSPRKEIARIDVKIGLFDGWLTEAEVLREPTPSQSTPFDFLRKLTLAAVEPDEGDIV